MVYVSFATKSTGEIILINLKERIGKNDILSHPKG
jgi:hypothetical protein